MKVNLLPKGKVQKWTLTFVTNDGKKESMEIDKKEDVFMELVTLNESGEVDMNSVAVFPPSSNVTYEELLAM